MSEPKLSRANLPKGFDWRSITPDDSPKGLPEVMAEHERLATPEVEPGGPAFDFELPVYDFSDGTEKATGRTFHLAAAAAERPGALISGSYT